MPRPRARDEHDQRPCAARSTMDATSPTSTRFSCRLSCPLASERMSGPHATHPLSLDCLPPEILRGICDRLLQCSTSTHRAGLHGVLSLARTSRAIHTHAIDYLWHTLPGYGFLVYTLPQDAWVVTVKPGAWKGLEKHLVRISTLIMVDAMSQAQIVHCGSVSSVRSLRRTLCASITTRIG